MTTASRRLRRLLLGVALAALLVPAAASAAHHPGIGHTNNLAAGEQTIMNCAAGFLVPCVVINDSAFGGLRANYTNASGNGDAITADTDSTSNITDPMYGSQALYGLHDATTGTSPAILGESDSGSFGAVAVQGTLDDTTAGSSSIGVYGFNKSTTGSGIGIKGEQDGSGWGVYGTTVDGRGVYGSNTGTASTGTQAGVYGLNNSDALNAAGVRGDIQAAGANAGSAGVYGYNGGTGALGIGVRGEHEGGGNGVYGSVDNAVVNAAGVLGEVLGNGGGGVGVYGAHQGSGYGVYGFAFDPGGAGVVGQAPAGGGWAGYFTGNVHVTGALSKGGGAFKIDHPLDPQNKYLQHSFVESPDMMNVYNGNIRTNAKGFATVKLPRYFSALNRDFRYQLTIVGTRGWRARVVDKIRNNRFTIQTDEARVEVSWQVTGIRKDRWANANRIQVEQSKAASERGTYLNPELYNASADKALMKTPGKARVPLSKATPKRSA